MAVAIQQRINALYEIQSLSAVLRTFYQNNANRFRHAEKEIRDWQSQNAREQFSESTAEQFVEMSRHEARAWSQSCQQAREMVGKLATLAIVHLPDAAAKRRLIQPSIDHWERDERFDWRAFEDELQLIHDDAIRAIANADNETVCRAELTQNVEVDSKKCRIRIGDVWHGVTPNQATILAALVYANGEYINVSEVGRPRDLKTLPPEVKAIVESTPGKGTRIPKEKLWLS